MLCAALNRGRFSLSLCVCVCDPGHVQQLSFYNLDLFIIPAETEKKINQMRKQELETETGRKDQCLLCHLLNDDRAGYSL